MAALIRQVKVPAHHLHLICRGLAVAAASNVTRQMPDTVELLSTPSLLDVQQQQQQQLKKPRTSPQMTTSPPPRLRYQIASDRKSVHVELDKFDQVLHHIWLRDHCQCPQCFHSFTQQRLVDTHLIPRDIEPLSLNLTPDQTSIEIIWKNDHHRSVFSFQWLQQNLYQSPNEKDIFSQRILWDTELLRSKGMPSVNYDEVMQTDDGLTQWLLNVAKWGFSFVKGVPATPAATEQLARRICFIRETIFGGFWDFKADLSHADTAYTSLALNTHTDTTYLSDPVGLQMFHLIESDCVGGQTTLLDGFKVAEIMKQNHPEDYEALCTIPIPSQYVDLRDGIELRPLQTSPIFIRDSSVYPARDAPLKMIRYNNDDRAPLRHLSLTQIDAFYKAHDVFNRYTRDPKYELRYQLQPGTVLLFDNQRALHGRTAFTGHRRLIGCYLNGDDYRSRLRGLLAKQQQA